MSKYWFCINEFGWPQKRLTFDFVKRYVIHTSIDILKWSKYDAWKKYVKSFDTKTNATFNVFVVMNFRLDMRKSVKVQVDSGFALLLPSGLYEIKKMQPRRRLRYIIIICVALAIAGIIGFGYFCPEQVCALTKRGAVDTNSANVIENSFDKSLEIVSLSPGISYDEMQKENFQFDVDAHDVMVFLHIQKTGGTSFGKHLVEDLDLKRPCECQQKRKRCYCFRTHNNENWLFSRYSTGWKCGLHADWTELTNCVDQELNKNEGKTIKRRYFYITVLREPIVRYLSEFRHVQRGATWKTSRHWCLGRQATASELPPCYADETWTGVNLDEFTGCDSNLATNRQTRMLSDLALIGCYNKSSMPAHARDRVMLASAKRNLATMSYFALTEYQKVISTKYLNLFKWPKNSLLLTLFYFVVFLSSLCRFLSMFLRRPSIYALPYHFPSKIQPFPVPH